MSVKALTLHQPWASLVAMGVKTVETRSWSTKYRGRLYIHAGTSLEGLRSLEFDYEDGWAIGSFEHDDDEAFCWQRINGEMIVQRYHGGEGPERLPLGAIVATCELVDVVPIVDREEGPVDAPTFVATFTRPAKAAALVLVRRGQTPVWTDIEDQRPYGDFTPGRFAWLLDDIKPVDPPVPCRGWQGLWNVPDDVLAAAS